MVRSKIDAFRQQIESTISKLRRQTAEEFDPDLTPQERAKIEKDLEKLIKKRDQYNERKAKQEERERIKAENLRKKKIQEKKRDAEKSLRELEKQEAKLLKDLEKIKTINSQESKNSVGDEKSNYGGKRKKQVKSSITKDEIEDFQNKILESEKKRADVLKRLASAKDTEVQLINEELAEIDTDIKYLRSKHSPQKTRKAEQTDLSIKVMEDQLNALREQSATIKKQVLDRQKQLRRIEKRQKRISSTKESKPEPDYDTQIAVKQETLAYVAPQSTKPRQRGPREITGKGLVSAAKSIGSVATASGFVLGGEHTQKLLGTAIAAKMAIGQLSSDYEGIRRGSGPLLGTRNSNRQYKDPAVDAIRHSEERIVTAIQTTNERLIDKQSEANKIAKDTLDFQEDNAKTIQENAEQTNRAIRSFRNAGESPSANMAKRLNPDGSPKEANKGWLASISSAFSNPLSTIGGLFAGKKLLGLGKGALGMIPKALGSIGKALMGGGLLASGASTAGKALSTGSKVVGSVAAKTGTAVAKSAPAIAKTITKTGVQGLTKIVGSSMLKKVPILGAIAGGAYAIGRALTGDYEGAGLELASGAASTIPGIGTGASIAIDAYSIKRDLDREAETLEVSQAQLSQAESTPAPVRPTYEGIPQPSAAPTPSVQNTQPSVAQRQPMVQPSAAPGAVESQQLLRNALSEQGINDPRAQANILAQVQAESNFRPKSENLNYSPQRLMEVFPSKFRDMADAQATVAAGKEAIGNRIYGNRMGNAEDEGYKYRGRGLIQLTGKNNYVKYSQLTGYDLVNNPDLANDPTVATKITAAYFANAQKNGTNLSSSRETSKAVGFVPSAAEFAKRDRLAQNFLRANQSSATQRLNTSLGDQEYMKARKSSDTGKHMTVNNINQRGNNNSGQTTARKAHVQPRYEEPTILTLMFQTLSGVVS